MLMRIVGKKGRERLMSKANCLNGLFFTHIIEVICFLLLFIHTEFLLPRVIKCVNENADNI